MGECELLVIIGERYNMVEKQEILFNRVDKPKVERTKFIISKYYFIVDVSFLFISFCAQKIVKLDLLVCFQLRHINSVKFY